MYNVFFTIKPVWFWKVWSFCWVQLSWKDGLYVKVAGGVTLLPVFSLVVPEKVLDLESASVSHSSRAHFHLGEGDGVLKTFPSFPIYTLGNEEKIYYIFHDEMQ